MPRSLYIVSCIDDTPVIPAGVFQGGDGCGWVRCGEVVNNKCIVMVNAPQSVLNTMGTPLNDVTLTAATAIYGVTIAAVLALYVGSVPASEGAIPRYQLPTIASTIPDDLPPTATGLFELLAAAKSGEAVSVPEGTYSGDFIVPAGVTLQPEAGARVVIDIINEFDMRGATVKDIEFLCLNTDRARRLSITMSAANSYLIGCHVHDLLATGVYWFGSGVGEVSECVIHNNIGHGLYSHNHAGGARLIEGNIFLPCDGAYPLHIFSGSLNRLADYTVRGNIFAGQDSIIGGGTGGVSSLLYEGNTHYNGGCAIGRYSASNQDCTVINNLLMGTSALKITDFETVTESGNTEVTTERVVIYPCTQSARKLAHIAVFNPAAAETVDLDLTALELEAGDYVLRNAQNLAEAHAFKLGENAVISVPMIGWTRVLRIGNPTVLPPTFPAFGAFILESA